MCGATVYGEVSGTGYARCSRPGLISDPGHTIDFSGCSFEITLGPVEVGAEWVARFYGRDPDGALDELDAALAKHNGQVDWSSATPEQADQMMAALDAMRRARDHLT
jgi:hypothetical protein